MIARRTLDALLARRVLGVRDRLNRRFDILLAEAAPALAAARTVAEATPIIQGSADDLLANLDIEEAATLEELLRDQPRTLN